MSPQDTPEGERLEKLLRQWGAEEAVRAEPAVTPEAPWRARQRPAWRRWLPLAAGFLMLAGGAAFFAASRMDRAADTGAAASSEEVAALRAALAQAETGAEASRAALAEAAHLRERQQAGFAAALKQAREDLAAEKGEAARQAQDRTDLLLKDLSEKQAALDKALAALKERDTRLAIMGDDLAKAREAAEKRVEDLSAETARLREGQQTAAAAQRDAERKLAAIQGQQAAMLSLFQDVCASTEAFDPEGLRTRQAALRHSQLLKRVAGLRPNVPNAPTRKLIDAMEVALTQLDLLDLGNRAEIEAFGRLLRGMDLTDRVREVLLGGQEDPAVGAWLMESQMLLSGMEHAG